MPHYIPKGEFIIFECILGDEIIKEIELSNPTNSQISYWVNLEGSSDFTTKNPVKHHHVHFKTIFGFVSIKNGRKTLVFLLCRVALKTSCY